MIDPGHLFLRRGLRAGLCTPVAFWFFGLILGPQGGLVSSFAVFSMLSLADFGGLPKDRLLANATLGLIGAGVVSLAGLAAQNLAIAVIGTGIVGVVASYLAVLRGYVGAATNAVIMPWVLGVTTTTSIHQVPTELAAWIGGGVVATLAAAFLWPIHERAPLRDAVASSLTKAGTAVAATLEQSTSNAVTTLRGFSQSIDAADTVLGHGMRRPGGGPSRDRFLLLLVQDLGVLRDALGMVHLSGNKPSDSDRKLAASCASTLAAASSSLLAGGQVATCELDAARSAHQSASEAALRLVHDAPPSFGPKALEVAAGSAIVASLTTVICTDVDKAVGVKSDEVSGAEEGRLATAESRGSQIRVLRANLTFASPWMRLALRTGVVLAAAVLIAMVTNIDHGFWIALGALAALKYCEKQDVGAAWRIYAGTVIGFALGAAIVLLAGSNVTAYWIILPVAVFLGAYTPLAGLLVGQAGFTIMMIAIFGVMDPGTYATGTFRLIDVGIGLAVSLIVGAMIMPRGILPRLTRTMSASTHAAACCVRASYSALAGLGSLASAETSATEAAKDLLVSSDTVEHAAVQAGPDNLQVRSALSVQQANRRMLFAADSVNAMTATTGPVGEPAAALADRARSVATPGSSPPTISVDTLADQAVSALDTASPHAGDAAMKLMIAAGWLRVCLADAN